MKEDYNYKIVYGKFGKPEKLYFLEPMETPSALKDYINYRYKLEEVKVSNEKTDENDIPDWLK